MTCTIHDTPPLQVSLIVFGCNWSCDRFECYRQTEGTSVVGTHRPWFFIVQATYAHIENSTFVLA